MATSAAAGAAAARARAIKASGVLIEVEPADFQSIINQQENPLIVCSESHFLGTSYKYLNSYKGLAFYCVSNKELMLPAKHERINARKIWIP
ncbi:MAG: hypothetical protein KDD94_14465 [Calditrichaeota bacterium]|nr:hypothetical protein [Calditrichota bacterium]